MGIADNYTNCLVFPHFLTRWEEGKSFRSGHDHGDQQEVLVGARVLVAGGSEGGAGREEAQSTYRVFLVKTRRDLWVSNQSTFIILVPVFFDSRGFSFIPRVFGANFYGRETEQLKNDDKKFWKQSLKLARLY